MKKYLLALGVWLVEKYGTPAPIIQPQVIPQIDDAVLVSASNIVRKFNNIEASSEYKRHAALADLIKLFPNYEKRVLCLAIELAVWKRHDVL